MQERLCVCVWEECRALLCSVLWACKRKFLTSKVLVILLFSNSTHKTQFTFFSGRWRRASLGLSWTSANCANMYEQTILLRQAGMFKLFFIIGILIWSYILNFNLGYILNLAGDHVFGSKALDTWWRTERSKKNHHQSSTTQCEDEWDTCENWWWWCWWLEFVWFLRRNETFRWNEWLQWATKLFWLVCTGACFPRHPSHGKFAGRSSQNSQLHKFTAVVCNGSIMCNGVQEDTRRYTVEEEDEEAEEEKGSRRRRKERERQTDRQAEESPTYHDFIFLFFLFLPPWKS